VHFENPSSSVGGSEVHYQISDKPIGAGGYGTVYKATRSSSIATFEFALKVLDPSPFIDDKEKAVERFKREINAIKLLQHRSIIPYIDAGIDSSDRPYLVMPLIDGEDFATSARRVSFGKRVRMMIEVLNGLSHAHKNNVLHRDLKPSNIIVRSSDLQPIILDFGQAYILENMDTNALTTSNIGTAGYTPSEVIADPKVRSKKHDIYSCGVILYEIFAGRKPDPMNLSSLRCVNDGLACLDAGIARALAPEHMRYEDSENFRLDLMAAVQVLEGAGMLT
jgi:serine/threonine protein kinase